jgi:hypothetical protein
MAWRSGGVVQVVDDLTGADGARTHRLRGDDTDVEIDLTDKNAADLEEVLAPYLAAGRPVTATSHAPRARRRGRSASSGSEDSRAIRTWAREQGHETSDRGQIPRAIRDAYRAAH